MPKMGSTINQNSKNPSMLGEWADPDTIKKIKIKGKGIGLGKGMV